MAYGFYIFEQIQKKYRKNINQASFSPVKGWMTSPLVWCVVDITHFWRPAYAYLRICFLLECLQTEFLWLCSSALVCLFWSLHIWTLSLLEPLMIVKVDQQIFLFHFGLFAEWWGWNKLVFENRKALINLKRTNCQRLFLVLSFELFLVLGLLHKLLKLL